MQLTITQSILFFGIISVTTIVLRFIPFVLFPDNKRTPNYIVYLGKVLPYTIIGMLVIYCLKELSFTDFPFALPEIISILVIIALHLWKSNTFFSIGSGTVLYMLLVQYVF